jgi:hypothetical protein
MLSLSALGCLKIKSHEYVHVTLAFSRVVSTMSGILLFTLPIGFQTVFPRLGIIHMSKLCFITVSSSGFLPAPRSLPKAQLVRPIGVLLRLCEISGDTSQSSAKQILPVTGIHTVSCHIAIFALIFQS